MFLALLSLPQGCGLDYGASNSTTRSPSGEGYRVTVGVWHHLALSYTGVATGGVETIYLDGVANAVYLRGLDIVRWDRAMIGDGYGTYLAISALRLYDGVLSAADVARAYTAEKLVHGK